MKWLCKKDFRMIQDNRIVFTSGKIYEEVDRCRHDYKGDQWTDVYLIDDDGEPPHGMDLDKDMKLYFEEVPEVGRPLSERNQPMI